MDASTVSFLTSINLLIIFLSTFVKLGCSWRHGNESSLKSQKHDKATLVRSEKHDGLQILLQAFNLGFICVGERFLASSQLCDPSASSDSKVNFFNGKTVTRWGIRYQLRGIPVRVFYGFRYGGNKRIQLWKWHIRTQSAPIAIPSSNKSKPNTMGVTAIVRRRERD
ncbi:BTB/POZ domain-containing protein NPY1-like [Pyrus ussuriensis x Pyrus communis]|uniref:BTB/POZ domain-containing protein NPY1-like n=1 Tax=Pyrus ussuriensis x Pyrus communis TaxID=2448454 RepID=A0A5N5IB36_9ROSA|nr:BTB/POZ domain-containing protein NPY1-like [Pyrus ussuriensis x Pyrus communis]